MKSRNKGDGGARAPVLVPSERSLVMRLSDDEHELLSNLVDYMADALDMDDFICWANQERKQLYGDDWTPDMLLTTEKAEKLQESLWNKVFHTNYERPGEGGAN
jgi:hypothetical protein